MMKKYLIIFLFFSNGLLAQKENNAYNFYIKPATSTINVNGKIDEAAWETISPATNFFQVQPMDTSHSICRTEVKLCYDQKNLYVLFINYKHVKKSVRVQSLKRDFQFNQNDNDLLFIDTFNDLNTGFSFGSNALGAQWDGIMSAGSKIDLSWENKWQSEATEDDEKWVWEAAIPFKSLRYKSEIMSWGINFSRLDLNSSEKSSWAPVPRVFPTSSLAFSGNLVWDKPPPQYNKNISLIPYISSGRFRDYESSDKGYFKNNIGIDGKIALNSSLNLDLTINPDFSQVEVDDQQINLDRFELFYPEKRQFFQENADIFSGIGNRNLKPFFSRRIGLGSPIYFGARISGKLNEYWRLGALNTQTGKNDNTLGANYTSIAFQRRLKGRSFITGMFTNKDLSLKGVEDKSDYDSTKFNRTLSIQYNLGTEDNKWKGEFMGLKTFSPYTTKSSEAVVLSLERSTLKSIIELNSEIVGKGVHANEIGYVQRTDYSMFNLRGGPIFYTKNSNKLVSHSPVFMYRNYSKLSNWDRYEYLAFLTYNFNFKNRSEASFWMAKDYVKIQNDFDPTNFVGQYLKAGTEHRWLSAGIVYSSKPQDLFTFNLFTRAGGYYAGGERYNIRATFNYRFQPYLALSLGTELNSIIFRDNELLPEIMKNKKYNIWLISPKIELTLTNKLFFTNYLQYNSQTNNVNFNSRFQWRYRPASDLFLVFTDNYLADNFHVRNRSIVLKFNYWWNL